MRRLLCCLLAVLLAVLPLAGCSRGVGDGDDAVQDDELRRILFVTDDIDAPFTAFVWELLCTATQTWGVQLTLSEVQYQADKASAALNQASDGLYDLVILDRLAGEMASLWVSRNAGYYPEVRYLCLDVVPGEDSAFDNVTSIVWDDLSLYYLYGAVAAQISVSGAVAFFASEAGVRSEWRFLAFWAGAVQQKPALRALYYTLGGDMPTVESVDAALQASMYDGADVFCVQSAAAAATLRPLLDTYATSEHPLDAESMVLIGGNMANTDVLDVPQSLAAFAFDAQKQLSDLFMRACQDQLSGGTVSPSMQQGDVRLVFGRMYGSVLDEDAQVACEVIQQQMRSGRLQGLPDLTWTEEERQSRIQQAAQEEQPEQEDASTEET